MQYIGSKQKTAPIIIDEIYKKVPSLKKEKKTVTDLFAGVGDMSREFKKRNHKVIANDIQYYSYIINKYYIGINSFKEIPFKKITKHLSLTPSNHNYYKIIQYLNNEVSGKEGFIYKNYTPLGSAEGKNIRKYFSNENGRKIDGIRDEIKNWYQENLITYNEYITLIATLIENIDKIANKTLSYNSYLKVLKEQAKTELILKPLKEPVNNHKKNKVYNTDANILIHTIKGDILYLDPPYNRRQYHTNYHLLETIAKYDDPILYNKGGFREEDRHKRSDYCLKTKAPTAFKELLKNAKFKHIFLNYKTDGLLSTDHLESICKSVGTTQIIDPKTNDNDILFYIKK